MDSMTLPRPEDIKDAHLVTHKNCMDGSGCSIMFLRSGGRRENIHFVSAGMLESFVKRDPIFDSDHFLIFADVGFNDGPRACDYTDRLEKRGNCVLIDHHKTSLHMAGRSWTDIRMDGCGTELLRQNLGVSGSSAENLSRVIDDHDRWLRLIPESSDLAMFVTFVGQSDFIERFRDRYVDRDRGARGIFSPSERSIIEILKKKRDASVERAITHVRARDVILLGKSFRIGYVISDDPNTSVILDELLNKRGDLQVAAQIMMADGKVSFRSRGEEFDVSELAQHFGGGGHRAAAGHRIIQSVIDEFITEIHAI